MDSIKMAVMRNDCPADDGGYFGPTSCGGKLRKHGNKRKCTKCGTTWDPCLHEKIEVKTEVARSDTDGEAVFVRTSYRCTICEFELVPAGHQGPPLKLLVGEPINSTPTSGKGWVSRD